MNLEKISTHPRVVKKYTLDTSSFFLYG